MGAFTQLRTPRQLQGDVKSSGFVREAVQEGRRLWNQTFGGVVLLLCFIPSFACADQAGFLASENRSEQPIALPAVDESFHESGVRDASYSRPLLCSFSLSVDGNNTPRVFAGQFALAVFRLGFEKGLFDSPPSLDASCDGLWRDVTYFFRPGIDGLRFAVERKFSCVGVRFTRPAFTGLGFAGRSLVFYLYGPSCPSAVSGFVVSVIIDSVEGVEFGWGRFWTHVNQEVTEAQSPSLANGDSTIAVVNVSGVGFASLNHVSPCFVFDGKQLVESAMRWVKMILSHDVPHDVVVRGRWVGPNPPVVPVHFKTFKGEGQ